MNSTLSLPRRGKIILSVLLFISIVLFDKCESENPVTRDYPRLLGTVVTNVSDSGATFSAELYSLGNERIVQSGFIWSRSNTDFEGSERVLLGAPGKTGTFSISINTTLSEGSKYFMKPFVQTEKHIIYGPVVTFVSLGSRGPVITGFSPDSAAWGDTIKIFGKHFSWISNKILLNNVQCLMTQGNDSVLYASIEPAVNSAENTISVEIAGNRTTYDKKKFRLMLPGITDFSPKEAFWGDTISITGKHLKNLVFNQNSVFLGNVRCPVFYGMIKDTVIKIKVHNDIAAVSNNLVINIGGFILNGRTPFTLKAPYFDFTPSEGTWNSILSFRGRFNSTLSKNSVYFNTIQASVLSVSDTSMVVKVPAALTVPLSSVKYDATPFSITSGTQFTLLPPLIRTFSPDSGPGGTSVTIKGRNFNSQSCTVKFGDLTGTVTSVSDSIIVAKVPTGIYGPVRISVKTYSQESLSVGSFNATNPVITGINPLSGTFNDEIIITGENFIPPSGYTTASFGNYTAEILSVDQGRIVVKVPVNMDSIPSFISVSAGSNKASSTDKFTLEPAVITSVSGNTVIPDQDVIISGENFNPVAANNKVIWDIYPLSVKSATNTEIVATWPKNLPRGSSRIAVIAGSYKRFSAEIIVNSTSKWKRLPSPQIKTITSFGDYFGMQNQAGSIGNYGLVVSGALSATYRFDPSVSSWEKLQINNPFPESAFTYSRTAVIKDTLYVMGWYGLKAYDPTNNSWRSINVPSESHLAFFSLNDKLWFGLNFPNSSFRQYFYKVEPASNYSWFRLSDFPYNINNYIFTTFSVGGKGYFILTNNHVYEFDPNSNYWTRKADFPGSSRNNPVSFVINGIVYYGTGTGTKDFGDIWKYNPLIDSWSYFSEMPLPRSGATAFTINNKAYIGFGISYNNYFYKDLFDFYEFDPSY